MVQGQPSSGVGREARPAARVARAFCLAAVAWTVAFAGCATAPPAPVLLPEGEVETEVENEGVDAVTEGLAPLPTVAPVVAVPRRPPPPTRAPISAPTPAVDPVQDVLFRLEKAVATCSGVVSAAGAAAAAHAVPPPPAPAKRKKRKPPAHPVHDNTPVVRRMIEDTTTDVRSIQQLVNAEGWTDDRNAIANLARRAAALEFTCVRLLQSISAP
jgi:hypothetical protein